mmetsp:Transcript_22624/g.37029  ORF Transcript_22624/g.37029 Transcript_22624/m.37029 type:complete len:247 (+) Transcript_22624:147-887(+)
MGARPGHNPRTARGVIAIARGQIAQHVGAIDRIIKTAPARIGGIQGKAGIHDGHDQLWAGDLRDLGIDIGGLNGKIRTFGHQIADLGQKGAIGDSIECGCAVGHMPGVDLGLHFGAFGQQGAVLGAEFMDQSGKACPKICRRDAGAWQGLCFNELRKGVRHLQFTAFNVVCHDRPLAHSLVYAGIPSAGVSYRKQHWSENITKKQRFWRAAFWEQRVAKHPVRRTYWCALLSGPTWPRGDSGPSSI